ncbi:MAG: hypothetical protein LBI53_02700 [Candidatus Peribacteria bacterium]|jgi:hypothetical protein|nr:hypothetical protein [Candidatus Peribacteria bacterium]
MVVFHAFYVKNLIHRQSFRHLLNGFEGGEEDDAVEEESDKEKFDQI